MSTTTIRIDEELKARVAAAARRCGKTSHAFIIAAISETVEQAERADEFHRIAAERWDATVRSGASISWDEMRSYLMSRAGGENPPKPKSRKLAR